MKILLLLSFAFSIVSATRAAESLPSWNDTAPKKAIITFVEKVTKEGSLGSTETIR